MLDGFDGSLLAYLKPDEKARLTSVLEAKKVLWSPTAGPQTEAYDCPADITGYGGAAGGGKSDLAIGLALTEHRRVGIFREKGTELTAIVDRIHEIVGSRDGYNGKDGIWRLRRKDGVAVQVELGSYPNPGDETKYQGRPHDLLVFDEAQNHREKAVRFLMGWLRSTVPGQRKRAVLTFNPPTSVRGRWIIDYFGPWLARSHPNPAKAGEIRWFAVINGVEREVASSEPFEGSDGKMVEPTSRTFIPSKIADNPYLRDTGYLRMLQGLPEPLRSQMLHGDFQAGMEDDPFQVCPTSWVEAAMAKWKKPDRLPVMDSIGMDVAMGGKDKTIIARRHGMWFDEPIVYEGRDCHDGPQVAGFAMAAKRNGAVIHIDLFGVGAKPYGALMENGQQVVGVNVGDPAGAMDASGHFRFKNLRSQLWWTFREALDPDANTGIVLPNDPRLLSDLCSATWRLAGNSIQVSSSEEMEDVINRSPDFGVAYVLGLMATPKRDAMRKLGRLAAKEFDPYRRL